MAVRGTVTRTISIPGFSLSDTASHTGSSTKRVSVTLPEAFHADLVTRTNNHSGICVIEDNHGLDADYDTVDLYSSTGTLLVKNCTITDLTGNVLTFDGTAVSTGMPDTIGLEFVCSKQIETDLVITDTAELLIASYNVAVSGSLPSGSEGAEALVQFIDEDNDYSAFDMVALSGGLDTIYDIEAGETESPIQDIASTTIIVASNPLETNRCVLQFGGLVS